MTELEEGSNMTTQQSDQERAEAFAERPVDVPNSGAASSGRTIANS